MKNKYKYPAIMAFLLIYSSSGNAQTNKMGIKAAALKPSIESETYFNRRANDNERGITAFGDTIPGMYWNFNGGLPNDWKMVDNTNTNHNWTWTKDSAINCVFVNNFAFKSTTASNGYMLFFGNKFNSDPTCATYLGDQTWDAYFQTQALNLSAYPSVFLKFQQALRWCCLATSNHSVFVSNDSINWTEYSVTKGLPANTTSANPDLVSLNISNVAANRPKVWIRFRIYNTAHYYWVVDDIAITKGGVNDLTIEKEAADFGYEDGGFYTKMPLTQASTTPITWRTAVFNNGTVAQNNAALTVDVSKGGTSVYNKTGAAEDIASSTTDTLKITTPFTPGGKSSDIGNYSFAFSVKQNETDENPSDNKRTVGFAITDTVFARDYGVPGSEVGPDNYLCCQQDGAEIGLLYQFSKDDEIKSISVFITSGTKYASGLSLYANVYQILANGTFNSVPTIQSDIYDVKASDLNSWLTIPFTGSALVNKDSSYIASIAVFGLSPTNYLRIGDDITVHQPDPAINPTTFIFGGSWYYVPNVPMIRLNTKSSIVGINELKSKFNLKVFPNPTNNQATIYANNLPDKQVSVSLMNLMGEVILSKEIATPLGQLNTKIELGNSSKGIYLLRIKGKDWEQTMKLVYVE